MLPLEPYMYSSTRLGKFFCFCELYGVTKAASQEKRVTRLTEGQIQKAGRLDVPTRAGLDAYERCRLGELAMERHGRQAHQRAGSHHWLAVDEQSWYTEYRFQAEKRRLCLLGSREVGPLGHY